VSLSPRNDTLYVADTLGNGIISIPHAMTRTRAVADRLITLASGGDLKQPLGLTIAPNGDIITTNAGDGNIVETDTSRQAGCGRCRRRQIRLGRAVRAGDHAQQRPHLRGRRAQHPADAPLTTDMADGVSRGRVKVFAVSGSRSGERRVSQEGGTSGSVTALPV